MLVEIAGAHARTYRVGGVSALILGKAYVAVTVLYVLSGAWPVGGENWLRYLSVHAAEWWAILCLCVLADVLILFVAWALFVALRKVNTDAMIVGCVLLLLFVAMDLSITWPSYYALLTLSERYTSSVGDMETRIIIVAANGAFDLLSASWVVLYAILAPSLGMLIIGVVMLRGHFSKTVGYLGVLTGFAGFASVVGPFFIGDLSLLVIIASLLSTIWFFFVGFELIAMSKKAALVKAGERVKSA